jgi:hypothetical protein
MSNLVTEEIRSFAWAKSYHDYLTLREKGLKSDSKIWVEKIILEIEDQDDLNKRRFVNCIFETAFLRDHYSAYIPFNLYHGIFIPVINNWIKDEPENSLPRRWSNDLENIKVAIQISPNDQIGLEIFATKVIAKISMNQHEISAGFAYDGNPIEDISLIEFCIKFVDYVDNTEKREYYQTTLSDLKQCALVASKNF